jgi:hypothetical protein
MKTLGAFILIAVPLAVPCAAFAQKYTPPSPNAPSYPQSYDPCQPGYSLQSQDRAAYDCAGTRGRIGLGADPMHPEGPGNFSGPGR